MNSEEIRKEKGVSSELVITLVIGLDSFVYAILFYLFLDLFASRNLYK